jgi:hypothetical protein
LQNSSKINILEIFLSVVAGKKKAPNRFDPAGGLKEELYKPEKKPRGEPGVLCNCLSVEQSRYWL